MPSLTLEVAFAAAPLIDASRPPAHDELTRIFAATRLSAGDPGETQLGTHIGKLKRVRAVLDYALQNDRKSGARLVSRLIASVRASGGFRPESDCFVGEATILNLRDAYEALGFTLDDDGTIHPQLLDHVPRAQQREVLATYVARIRRGATDAPLVTGTGKDLLEATARQVLETKRQPYSGNDFPGTLFHAFDALGLPTPSVSALQAVQRELTPDPRAALMEVLYLLGCQVNRLRNAQGTGHGRPFMPDVTPLEAKVSVQGMALVTELLLAAESGER